MDKVEITVHCPSCRRVGMKHMAPAAEATMAEAMGQTREDGFPGMIVCDECREFRYSIANQQSHRAQRVREREEELGLREEESPFFSFPDLYSAPLDKKKREEAERLIKIANKRIAIINDAYVCKIDGFSFLESPPNLRSYSPPVHPTEIKGRHRPDIAVQQDDWRGKGKRKARRGR